MLPKYCRLAKAKVKKAYKTKSRQIYGNFLKINNDKYQFTHFN